MDTKHFYYDGIWEEIINHPRFDLGRRELEALKRFMPTVADYTKGNNILHLGAGIGREIPTIIKHLETKNYLVNDICAPCLKKITARARVVFSSVKFFGIPNDIEEKKEIFKLRQMLHGSALIVLVANGVIFSKPGLESDISRAMERDDLFLITLEMPNPDMANSYLIEPVLKLLSQSGLVVTAANVKTWYDINDQRFRMSCQGNALLSSYKPKPEQLQRRLKEAGMDTVVICEYSEIHMVAGLFKKKRKAP